jgi:hypothetical protein
VQVTCGQTHTPLSQAVLGAVHVETQRNCPVLLAWQVSHLLVSQTTPQAPQFVPVLRAVQTPPQQSAPEAHWLPHVPQLFLVWFETQMAAPEAGGQQIWFTPHGVFGGSFVLTHPVAGLHVSVVHGLLSSQLISVPAQIPVGTVGASSVPVQTSLSVHALLSLQR